MSLIRSIKDILLFLHIDLTKNLAYDRMTNAIMRRTIGKNTHCMDIGCHKGEILRKMLKLSPEGTHYGFEPIPRLYQELVNKYGTKAQIFPYAVSDKNGEAIFHIVENDLAYSGIHKRKYKTKNPIIHDINVTLKSLDEIFPEDTPVGFIKIDVEGGEFDVLKGGEKLIRKNKPFIIFEFGLGASDYYGIDPLEVYQFITERLGLRLATLRTFLKKRAPLKAEDFKHLYETNKEYYFIACK